VDGALSPTALVALTSNRYLPPAGSATDTVRAFAAAVASTLTPVGVTPSAAIRSAVILYPVIAEPPVLPGAVQFAVAVRAPPTAPCAGARMPGAFGTVAGVTALEAADSGP